MTVSAPSSCVIVPGEGSAPGIIAKAEALAVELNLPFHPQSPPPYFSFALIVSNAGLALHFLAMKHSGVVRVDFSSGKMHHRLRTLRAKQPLGRALGLDRAEQGQWILDATAGLGTDAVAFAYLGHHVVALERHPVIYALLRDGLRRAAQHEETVLLAERITLIHVDAHTYLNRLNKAERFSGIYYDPMYPEKRRKSARPPKEMQALQALVGEDMDELAVLAAARAVAPRVAVKRPIHAPELVRGAAQVVKGKMVRFDVYLQ